MEHSDQLARSHYRRVADAIERESAAHSVITASWRRSMLHHKLAPDELEGPIQLTERELREASQNLDLLQHVAQPFLEQLFTSVAHSGCCVVFTDANGVVLRRLSSDGDTRYFNEWGLQDGAIWSEQHQGTNGIGTCVVEQRPVVIRKEQHFNARNVGMTCMGAPIFGADDQVIAVLDVSSARDGLGEELAQVIASLVSSAANRIEAEYFRAVFSDAQIVVAPGFSPIGTPLLASDADDLVIGANRAARRLFNLSRDSLHKPIPRAELMPGVVKADDLQSAERTVLRQAIARAGGNMSLAAKELDVSRATFYRMLKRHGIARSSV